MLPGNRFDARVRRALSGFCLTMVFALAAVAAAPASSSPTATPSSEAPPLLRARAAHAVVTTGDAIVALGGTGAGGRPVLDVERFGGTR
jgi:hypothetical protein